MKLLGRHDFDPAVGVLVVVPDDKRCHALTGLVLAAKRITRVIKPLLHRPEQRFGVRAVVADSCPGEWGYPGFVEKSIDVTPVPSDCLRRPLRTCLDVLSQQVVQLTRGCEAATG